MGRGHVGLMLGWGGFSSHCTAPSTLLALDSILQDTSVAQDLWHPS